MQKQVWETTKFLSWKIKEVFLKEAFQKDVILKSGGDLELSVDHIVRVIVKDIERIKKDLTLKEMRKIRTSVCGRLYYMCKAKILKRRKVEKDGKKRFVYSIGENWPYKLRPYMAYFPKENVVMMAETKSPKNPKHNRKHKRRINYPSNWKV